MSDTISDIEISNTEFVDVNTLSGLVAGTAIVISNKSDSVILLQISASQPVAASLDGERLEEPPHRNAIRVVTTGENTVWAKSIGRDNVKVSVQDNT